ncbi:PPC domain-containing DNA-binding protein [Ferrimonas futtsuensis]|uniref:PPC domain-containing DNA-binding protein n=1 Tax=Ferrimonas futtsuensis TaxID=364764 RepID=UPI00048815F6|nr:PPC domain-containing DNA-binding protein [Ferrimonas futtsuensis]
MITPIAIRLTKGDDLKKCIQQLVAEHGIQAGSIASCVGCLTHLQVRLAGATEVLMLTESVEIVSVMGTLTPDHQHIHLSVAKRSGDVVGGHLLEGCVIDTTAELIIHQYHNLSFGREPDPHTGFTELTVGPQGQ